MMFFKDWFKEPKDFRVEFAVGVVCALVGVPMLFNAPDCIGIGWQLAAAILFSCGGSFIVNGALSMKGLGGWG